MGVSGEFDTPAALPRSKIRSNLWIGCSEVLRPSVVHIGKGDILEPTENQSTIARLSSQYPRYYTN